MLIAANPAALLALLAIPALWWLHRARRRPIDLPWPGLLLWKMLPPPTPAAAARHRRRVDLAFALAAGGVGAMVAGAAGLSIVVRAPEPPRVGVVVDATASARGAWEAIRGDAGRYLSGLPAGAVVDIAVVPGESRVGVTAGMAMDVLARAVPTDAPGDVAAAASRFTGAARVAVFSDRAGPEELGTWRVHPAGPDAAGVAALSVADGRVLAVLTRSGGDDPVRWTLTSRSGSVSGTLPVPAGGAALLDVPAPDTGEPFTLSVPPDAFPANDARHWASPGAAAAVSVAGRDSLPVRRALEAVGLAPVAGGADARIWIGEVPPVAPGTPAILIDPARGIPGLFEVEGSVEEPVLGIAEAADPLLRAAAAADLDRLTVLRSTRLRFLRPHRPLLAPVLYESEGILVFAFDPAPPNSNFSRLVAFPLLWAEAARRLHPAPRRALATGRSLSGQVLFQSGLVVRDGEVWAVNIEDPEELFPPHSTPAAPALDLPSRSVIRSRSTLTPTVAAIAGLSLLILSWLVSRTRS